MVGYSWNSPTCSWPWLWLQWPIEGFRALQYGKHNISLRNPAPKSETRRSRQLSFLAMDRWMLRWKDNRVCFVKHMTTDTFLATMALQTISRHARSAKERLHLCLTGTDSWHQTQRNCRLNCHMREPVTIRELKVSQLPISHPDRCIPTLRFPALNFSILMHMARIASTMQISIQICWPMKEHPPVGTPSAVW